MSLNPHRINASRLAPSSAHRGSPFKTEADAALAEYQAARASLERDVRDGNITVKVARERAASLAARLREQLMRKAETYSPTPRIFLDRLTAVSEARRLLRANASTEALQRDVIQLLRKSLIEQQIVNRASEFESKAFRRALNGSAPAPTLESLLLFHQNATLADDEAAQEWARRQLESMRQRGLSPEENLRIDAATDRPDRVNPRTVARYVEAMRGQAPEALETFVTEALHSMDASATAAAFVLAREQADPTAHKWVRALIERLGEFPDSALNCLHAWEAEARAADAEAARQAAELAATIAEAEARFPALQQPTPEEIQRRESVRARRFDASGEPVGLAFHARSPRASLAEVQEPAASDPSNMADAGQIDT